MKNWLIIFITFSSLNAASVQHEVVFKGGISKFGYVTGMTADSIQFTSWSGAFEESITLDSIMYIHNTKGKLFYVSDELWSFIARSLGRGGVITTTKGEFIPYYFLGEEMFMYNPKLVYYTPGSQNRQKIPLTEIHKIEIDFSLSESAAKKGFYLGSGISLLLYLSKFRALNQFYNFDKVFNEFNNVYPSSIVAFPLTTLGWIVYDFFRGDRELIISPRVDNR